MLVITILVLVLLFIFVQVVGHAMRKSQPRRGLIVTARFVDHGAGARAEQRQRENVQSPAIRHFFSQVHGITHRNQDGTSRQSIISHCCVGEEVLLIPEPNNRYDEDAIKICRANGEQLGYWSGGDGRMADELNNGKRFRVTIDEIYPFEEDRRKHGVRLRVDVLS